MSSANDMEVQKEMTTVMIVVNAVFIAGILAVIVGGHLFALATQHRDHGVVTEGPVLRRNIWSERRRRPRPVRVERRQTRPAQTRAGQPWPAA